MAKDLISKAKSVGFELDGNYELIEGDTACKHSARFQSVIGTGNVTFVEEPKEKQAALQSIMLHNTGKDHWDFPDAMLHGICIFKLEVKTLSCKEHL